MSIVRSTVSKTEASNDTILPIGIFDSGAGGLSIFQAIRKTLPREDVIYLADSANAPYGDRSTHYVLQCSSDSTKYLLNAGVKLIVVACNTATSVAIESIRTWCPVPVVAVEPAIKPALAMTKSGVVGVLGTTRTIYGDNTKALCARYGTGKTIKLQPCPGLVDQIESGNIQSDTTYDLLVDYTKPLLDAGADVLALGCTHYSFLNSMLSAIVGDKIQIVDTAPAIAREVGHRLEMENLATRTTRHASSRFLCSGSSDRAAVVFSNLLGSSVTVEAVGIAQDQSIEIPDNG